MHLLDLHAGADERDDVHLAAAVQAGREIGFMPAFRDSLDDRQIADLAAYMRQRFARGKSAWRDLQPEVARLGREAIGR